jgi:serine/threonine-protein kinase
VSEKQGTTVDVVLSDGPPDVAVPSLTGLTCPTAQTALVAAGFKISCAPPVYNDSIATGTVILWSIGNTANPTKAPYGSTITVVPSNGHAPVTVPSIPNSYTYQQASAALTAVGLNATQTSQSSASVPQGQVISTTPASGAPAPFGSTVTVTVSSGPPTTTVPNVFDDTVEQATNALESAGLSVGGVTGNPNNPVVGTVPSQGSTVPTGSSVQLVTKH